MAKDSTPSWLLEKYKNKSEFAPLPDAQSLESPYDQVKSGRWLLRDEVFANYNPRR